MVTDGYFPEKRTREQLKEKREADFNILRGKPEQTINPITGQGYNTIGYGDSAKRISCRKYLDDPLQAHLREMEMRNPSESIDNRSLVRKVGDWLHYVGRAIECQDLDNDFYISKAQEKRFKDHLKFKHTIIDITDFLDKKDIKKYDKKEYLTPKDLNKKIN